MKMSHHRFFEIFRIKIWVQVSTFFSLQIFLYYIDTHSAWERKLYSLAFIYSKGCKCSGRVKCLWESELMRGPLPEFCLIYINAEYMCNASYVTWKYIQYRRYHANFVRKFNIPGARFHRYSIVVAPNFLPNTRHTPYDWLMNSILHRFDNISAI